MKANRRNCGVTAWEKVPRSQVYKWLIRPLVHRNAIALLDWIGKSAPVPLLYRSEVHVELLETEGATHTERERELRRTRAVFFGRFKNRLQSDAASPFWT